MARDEEIIEKVAAFAHEVNKLYCEFIGDFSQPSWKDAPDWQKESIRIGVLAIVSHPALTPEKSHGVWLEHKRADGWKYGPVKDAEKKEHPYFMAYEDLLEVQKMKDRLFGAVVRIGLIAESY